jgi:hypothetical protein
LRTVLNLAIAQLEGDHPPLLCGANLPPDITLDPNRDWERLAAVMHQQYPERFETLAAAEEWVAKRRLK